MKKQDHSRFIVGIDLGTTSISLSYLDTLEEKPQLKTLPIAQWEEEGKIVEKEILPSFCYIAQKKEVKRGSFLLPFYQEKTLPSLKGKLFSEGTRKTFKILNLKESSIQQSLGFATQE